MAAHTQSLVFFLFTDDKTLHTSSSSLAVADDSMSRTIISSDVRIVVIYENYTPKQATWLGSVLDDQLSLTANVATKTAPKIGGLKRIRRQNLLEDWCNLYLPFNQTLSTSQTFYFCTQRISKHRTSFRLISLQRSGIRVIRGARGVSHETFKAGNSLCIPFFTF